MGRLRITISVAKDVDEREVLRSAAAAVDRSFGTGINTLTNTRGELWPRSRGRDLVIVIDGPDAKIAELSIDVPGATIK